MNTISFSKDLPLGPIDLYMKAMLVLLLIFNIWLLAACGPQHPNNLHPDQDRTYAVIYGEDSRQDLPTSSLTAQARATAVFISQFDLKPLESGAFSFRKIKLRAGYPLCEDERFLDQYLVGKCTGVLIGPHHVLTAGHCFLTDKDCSEIQITFGFNFEKSRRGFLNKEDLYSCRRVLFQSPSGSSSYSGTALIELDRRVTDANPVKIATAPTLAANEIVYNYSYPLGLPLKGDIGKIVKNDPRQPFFEVAIDTFSGSSGSGLFNQNGELIGILDNGAEDFLEEDIRRVQTSGGCLNFHRCHHNSCTTHERFLKIQNPQTQP